MSSDQKLVIGRRPLMLAVASLAALPACGMLIPSPPVFRTTRANARMLAFQTEAFARGFGSSHASQWVATLERVEKDALVFLRTARDKNVGVAVKVSPYVPERGDADIETYEVEVAVEPAQKAKGAVGQPVALPGKAGTDESVHAAAVKKAASATGLDPELVRLGHFAIYAQVNMMTALNASHTSLRRHAFALMVLREKVKNGEKADWFDPNRPAEETNADIDDALKIIAEHDAFIAGMRGEVLALTALAAAYRDDAALRLYGEKAAAWKTSARAWQQAHPPMNMEEIETRVRGYANPQNIMQQAEDQAGFLAAVIEVAKGVATGSPSATLDGLAKLAPKDSSVRTAIEGLAAASKGDIVKAADAALKLAGSSTSASDVKDTFEALKKVSRS